AAGLLFLVGGLAPLVAEAAGQRAREVLHSGNGLARAVPGRAGSVDGGRAVYVVALEVLRTVDGFDLDQGAERHHGTGGATHVETIDVFGQRPVLAHGLRHDPVGPTVQVEVVDVVAAEKSLQSEKDVAQQHAERLHFVAVHVVFDLRYAWVEAAVDEADSRLLARASQK